MRIELVTTGLQRAGAERIVFELARGMASRGHAVSVTSLTAPKAYADELAGLGIAVRSLGLDRNRKSSVRFGAAVLAYRRDLAARRLDVVNAHMVHANLFARAAIATLPSVRLVSTIHNTYEGGRLRDLAYRLTNFASDLDVTVSDAATRRYVADGVLPRERTLTIHNGIEIPPPAAPPATPPDGPFRWIAIGRLEPQKDYPALLRAMTRLPGTSLSIAGDGSERGELAALVHEHGLGDRVAFLGVRTDIRALLAAHDGYVLSSQWEGFGLALAEAMAAGLPVVATKSGGPSEVVGDDGQCGILVEPGNDRALAAAMKTVAALPPEERAAMGRRGRERIVQRFSLEGMLDRWEAVYRRVAAAA